MHSAIVAAAVIVPMPAPLAVPAAVPYRALASDYPGLHQNGLGHARGTGSPNFCTQSVENARGVVFCVIWPVHPDMMFSTEFQLRKSCPGELPRSQKNDTTSVFHTLGAEIGAPSQTPWDAQAYPSPFWVDFRDKLGQDAWEVTGASISAPKVWKTLAVSIFS